MIGKERTGLDELLSWIAWITIIQGILDKVLPAEIRQYLLHFIRRSTSGITLLVGESHQGSVNQLYGAVVTYLGSHALSSMTNTPHRPHRLTVGKKESMKVLTFGLDKNSQIVDTFHGVPMKWTYCTDPDKQNSRRSEISWFELSFHKRYTDMVKDMYLPHIQDMAKRIKDENRVVNFFTNQGGHDSWSSGGGHAIQLDHPMTFKTLAMDGDLKQRVINDLDDFMEGKDYYKKIGKAWKRGYLLYGPPGTGKSSLIAAMANYLNFDIYNLNLSAVTSDSTLQYLLLHMSKRSILVVEDIDCFMLPNRQQEDGEPCTMPKTARRPVTLAGLLNAIDGLLSCCGEERISVFTTNNKDSLDPALVRPGRMDMHINLSYCTFSTFKQLADNYLEISDHDLFPQIENLIAEVQVSPADVAGELMKIRNPKTCLEELIKFLQSKVSEAKSSAPELKENGFDGKPEQNGTCEGLNKENEHQKTTESADKSLPNQKETSFRTDAEYTIKEELQPILKAVLSEHGDITANCSLRSMQCRSYFLEILCGIIQKLTSEGSKDITPTELGSMSDNVRDLESVGIEVGWLRKKLGKIKKDKLLAHHAAEEKDKST